MDMKDPNPRGMAAIAKGLVQSFENGTSLIQVGNVELLLNEGKTHYAIVDGMHMLKFYRADVKADELQAIYDLSELLQKRNLPR